jgi:hypothetical protein
MPSRISPSIHSRVYKKSRLKLSLLNGDVCYLAKKPAIKNQLGKSRFGKVLPFLAVDFLCSLIDQYSHKIDGKTDCGCM